MDKNKIKDENLDKVSGGALDINLVNESYPSITLTREEYNSLVKGGYISKGAKSIKLTDDALRYLENKGFSVKMDTHYTRMDDYPSGKLDAKIRFEGGEQDFWWSTGK